MAVPPGNHRGSDLRRTWSVRRKVRDPRTPGRTARSALVAGGSCIMRASIGCRMMHRSRQTVFWLVLTICSGVSVFSVVQAQEEVYRLEQVGIFGTLRRPAV